MYGKSYTELGPIKADLIFTSPPYNIGSKARRQDGMRKRGLFDPKSYGGIVGYPDTIPEGDYQHSQIEFLIWCGYHLSKNGILVYNHKPRRINGSMIHPALWFLDPKVSERLVLMEEIIWDRGSTHNHCKSLAWPTTERLYVFRRIDGAYHKNSVDGFNDDHWFIPLSSRSANKVGHPCPFSMKLARAVIMCWSNRNQLVCDPYSGSGTTMIAALELKRRFIGTELLMSFSRANSTISATQPHA